eukprot:1187518-Prorocentrum_minimum.AAC.1
MKAYFKNPKLTALFRTRRALACVPFGNPLKPLPVSCPYCHPPEITALRGDGKGGDDTGVRVTRLQG